MNKKISIFDAVVYGFKSIFDNFRLFFLAALTLAVVTIAGGVAVVFSLGIPWWMTALPLWSRIAQGCQGTECAAALQGLMSSIKIQLLPFLLILFIVVLFLIAIHLGFIKLCLEFYDTGSSSVSRIFSQFKNTVKAFIAGLFYFVMVVAGLIAFIFPGLYLMFRFCFFAFLIVDKNAGIFESLKQSWALTRGYGWQFFALLVALLAIMKLGIPVCMILAPLCWTYFYRNCVRAA